MEKENPKLMREINKVKVTEAKDLKKDIERIHQRYGNNLEAFFRDAKESLLKRGAMSEKKDFYKL